jgi:replicative DNA helicase
MGKSSWALNIVQNSALRSNATCAVFSLEMSKAQLAHRLLCSESGVDATKLRLGMINDAEQRKLHHALAVLSEAPIYIDDTPSINLSELRSKARRLASERGIDMVVVDYLQLITTGRSGDNRVQEISEISRSLKALARELNCPVIALSQLSRAVESRTPKIPMLSDLRESGSIEQDADIVLFIYREDMYNRETEKKGIADIIVAKHRNGPTGQFSLLFLERTTRFVDLEARPSDWE